jgi:hypothetical protein
MWPYTDDEMVWLDWALGSASATPERPLDVEWLRDVCAMFEPANDDLPFPFIDK